MFKLNPYQLVTIFEYANKHELYFEANDENDIILCIARLSYMANKYDIEIKRFYLIIKQLQKQFGENNIYFEHLKTPQRPGHANVTIKGYAKIEIHTDLQFIGVHSIQENSIATCGGIIDKTSYLKASQDEYENESRLYDSVNDLISAISEVPMWKNKIEDLFYRDWIRNELSDELQEYITTMTELEIEAEFGTDIITQETIELNIIIENLRQQLYYFEQDNE
jgi:hypothetical protein